jgi:hypothetical protein
MSRDWQEDPCGSSCWIALSVLAPGRSTWHCSRSGRAACALRSCSSSLGFATVAVVPTSNQDHRGVADHERRDHLDVVRRVADVGGLARGPIPEHDALTVLDLHAAELPQHDPVWLVLGRQLRKWGAREQHCRRLVVRLERDRGGEELGPPPFQLEQKRARLELVARVLL